METGIIVTIVVVGVGNIVAWSMAFGRINQQVKEISNILHNGIVEEIRGYGKEIAKLEGIPERVATACDELAELKGKVKGMKSWDGIERRH